MREKSKAESNTLTILCYVHLMVSIQKENDFGFHGIELVAFLADPIKRNGIGRNAFQASSKINSTTVV